MPTIAIFDSGLGSLSIISQVQRKTGSHVVYFADQKSYPYGTKSPKELGRIINLTIKKLRTRFEPDLIVVASNTPSLLLNPKRNASVLWVYPPLQAAVKKTSTKTIAVLATRSAVNSKRLQDYINQNVPDRIKVVKIDASGLVDLVESGKFVTKKELCVKKIKRDLRPITEEGADVATLSSTHLPFLLPMLKKSFPRVTFLDPAESVADEAARRVGDKGKARSTLEIFASGSPKKFEKKLEKIGITKRVQKL